MPTHHLNSRPLNRNCFRLLAQHQRAILSMAEYEFSEAAEGTALDRPGLHFDCPLVPRAFENRINLEWLLAPIGHLLPGIPCMCETGILRFTSGRARERVSPGTSSELR